MILQLHEGLAWVFVVGNGIAGVWALTAHWVPPVRVRPLWWFVIAVQIVVPIQVILGVMQQSSDARDAPGMHLLYGFTAFAAVGIIYSYRQQMQDRQYLLYGLGCLFIMGLGIRAMFLHY